MRRIAFAISLLTLAGCSRSAAPRMADAAAPAAPPATAAMGRGAMATEPAPADAATPRAAQAPVPAGVPMMAYSYDFGIEADPGRVRALEAKHEQACAAAGSAVCVVTGSNVTENGRDRIAATLTFRAAPVWLATFRAGLPKDADDAGGRVTRAQTTSEDLSRQIVDTEADLRARTTLRDRLQQILATRPGKISELLEVEEKLSEVQGQIDTTNSELAMMRQRVATSEVTINYASAGVLAPQGMFAPLAAAFSDFLGIVVGVVAFMVRLVAFLAPWALVIGGLWWLLRKRLPRLSWPFGKKKPPQPPAA